MSIKAVGEWNGDQLYWVVEPNYGAFCVKDRDMLNIAHKETGKYADIVRVWVVDAVCRHFWKKHNQQCRRASNALRFDLMTVISWLMIGSS